VVDQVLGEAPGWFSCGELRLLWKNYVCGCGTPLRQVWLPELAVEQTNMDRRSRVMATIPALPLMPRYRYSLRG
jgi:hypothetical protein